MRTERSDELFERARSVLVGGVDSPVRAMRAVGRTPLFIAAAEGAWLTDEDGHRYVDLVGSWGPMVCGHRHPAVVAAVEEALAGGTSFGAPSHRETLLAEEIVERVPGVEQVRFTSSGTEASMTALRLARGATGRDPIVKFEGCYHGHVDALLASAGSGVATLGLPDSPGVTAAAAADTRLARFNDLDSVDAVLDGRCAAVIVEPVAGNMGCVPPAPGFLEGLRERCDRHGALLIVDEVMTGFRVARGGAQARFGVRADLTCFGKVIGGGMPVGAVAGPRALMSHLAPEGSVYQAGTLSGNPLAMAAGLATLRLLDDAAYERLEAVGGTVEEALAGVPGTRVQRVGSMVTAFFTDEPAVRDYDGARRCDAGRFARFHAHCLEQGVYLPPSQFEAAFLSTAHDGEALETVAAACASFGD
jgi:glutamate-1-semialdehyde 2,1-aminomutase